MSSDRPLRARIGAVVEERIALGAPSRRLRVADVDELIASRERAQGLRVLDAGCGDGLLTLALAERHRDWTFLGVDLREELLRRARARALARGLPNVRFQRADVTQQLPEGDFDVVLSIECLEEIVDDRAAIGAMGAALAPDGMLIVHVPERSWRAILPGSASTWRDQVRQGYRARELSEALHDEGLEVVTIRPTFRGTAVVAQELADRVKRAPLPLRTALFPGFAAAVRLERLGLTWGAGHALLAAAVRPGHESPQPPRSPPTDPTT
jgi:SAM-dependent methyltransferase